MSFAVWLTGLSGSGKSAIARELMAQLHARGVDAALLESDAMRMQLTPFPRYDERERDLFYAALVHLGAFMVGQGRAVLFDATANRRAYRDAARRAIANFAEVLVDTPPEVCAARDPKGLYRRAREGKSSTLPGVQAPYEPPLAPELVIRGDRGTPAGSAAEVIALLERRGWLPRAARWEHYEHGADIGVRGFGPTKAGAFEQAALALTAVVTDPATVAPLERVVLECEAPDDELLLAQWLNGLVYEMSVRRMLFSKFHVRIDAARLSAEAWGEGVDVARHHPAVEVKGATYTTLRVARDAPGWVAQTVIDV
jgi:adenylylsulfate kinase-like enzyme/SHS2 domain-containing protein